MRVLFVTYPQKTHFFLQAPLAWALQSAGHEVRIASQPEFAEEIAQAGLTPAPVGRNDGFGYFRLMKIKFDIPEIIEEGLPQPYDAAIRPPDDVTWEYLRDGMAFMVDRWHRVVSFPLFKDLVALAQRWRPDLVLWEASTYAGGVAAKACGAAHARVLFGLDVLGATREQYLRRLERQRPDERADPLGEWLAGYARKYGVDYSEDLATGQFTIDQYPHSLSLESDLPHLQMRYTPYGGRSRMEPWLRTRPEKPRIALTMGMSAENLEGYDLTTQEVLDALAPLDIEVIATVPENERAGLTRIPGNTQLVGHAPLDELAVTCSAIVHHAGAGTVLLSSLYGVPQLSLPEEFDAHTLARRLEDQDAGLTIDPAKATGEMVRDGVLRLLNESRFREGSARLRAEMLDMPTAHELVDALESHVAAHGRSGRRTTDDLPAPSPQPA